MKLREYDRIELWINVFFFIVKYQFGEVKSILDFIIL